MIRENDNFIKNKSIEELEEEKIRINKSIWSTFNPFEKLRLSKKELKINEQIAKLTVERTN